MAGNQHSECTDNHQTVYNTFQISTDALCEPYITVKFGEWVLVSISPWIFMNGYIMVMSKQHINLATKSITFDRCSRTMASTPVPTIWRRHWGIFRVQAGMILPVQHYAVYYQLPINAEIPTEAVFSIVKKSNMSAMYPNRYIIWQILMSVEDAKVLNNPTQSWVGGFRNSEHWIAIP